MEVNTAGKYRFIGQVRYDYLAVVTDRLLPPLSAFRKGASGWELLPRSSNRNIKWRSQEQNGIVKVTHMPQYSLNTVRIREGKLLLVFIHDHTWLLCSSMSFSWLPESVDIYTKLLWPTSWCYRFSTTDLVWMYEAVWSWPAHSGLVSFFAHHLFSY